MNGKSTMPWKFLPAAKISSSCSSSCLLSVFKKLEKLNKQNSKVSVNWIYEENDEDILAAGKNFQGMVDLPFTMIPVAES